MQIFILGIRRESKLRHYEFHKSPHAYQFLQVTAGERRGPARPAPLRDVVTVRRDEQEGEGLQAAAAAPPARLPGGRGQRARRGEGRHRHTQCRSNVVASASCQDRRPRCGAPAPGSRNREATYMKPTAEQQEARCEHIVQYIMISNLFEVHI